jgi:hypothetical protein
MAPTSSEWKVLPHGPLERLSENLLWVSGSLPGMSLKRTMTVARLDDGRLIVHSAIALDESSMKELEAFGRPTFLVVPNGYHRLDAPAYLARYPNMAIYAPKGSRRKIEEVVPVTASLDAFPPSDSVRFEDVPGVPAEAALWVRSTDGLSLVLTDVVFNMDRKRDLPGFLFTSILGSAPGPRISRLAKLVLVRDRRALRAGLEQWAALPNLKRLIVAHEKIAAGKDAGEALLRAATYL